MSGTGFSYAQAARGQSTPSQASTPPASNTAAGSLASPEKDDDSSSTTVSQNGTSSAVSIPSVPPVPSTTTDISKASARTLNHDVSASPLKVGSDAPSSPAASSTLAGTIAESTSNFSLDDATVHVAASDKPSRVSTPGTRSPASDDAVRKGGRKSKAAAKAADKDGEQSARTEDADKDKEPVKIELAPAPLPSVNIWSQRMIEQAAKVQHTRPTTSVKSTASTTPGATAGGSSSNSGTKNKDARKQGNVSIGGDAASDANGVPSSGSTKTQTKRQNNESTRAGGGEQPRRNAPRGSRTAEKEEKPTTVSRDPLPSVRDAVSWPTPDSAAVSDDPKAKLLGDKTEAAADKDAQDDAGSAKSRKKGWLPLPFVPSVNFQTPIPNVRGSKPKTGNRASRDASSRSGYNNGSTANGTAPNEKSSFVASSSSPVDKADYDVRDVAKESNGSALPTRPSTHAPSTHKRFSTDTTHSHPREPRKPSTTTLPHKPKEPVADQQTVTGKAEFVPKGTHTSAHSGITNGDTNGQQYHQPTHLTHLDRRPPFASKNTSHYSSLGKDFSSQEHKEQHHGQNPRDRTEPRGERPSRGGFRGGRGGGVGAGSAQNQHLGHPTYQPNGQRVASNAAYSTGAAVLPPTAAPFNPPPPSQQFSYGNTHNAPRLGARNASRAQLASQTPASFNNRLQNGVGNNSNNNPRLHGHPSHGSAPSGPSEFQMPSYSFSAFNPYMDAELVHGLMLQVDYYFSLDNLVKDVFLRRKMNDQGFVPLLVIAKFKRMSELAPSIDFIRAACEQSENLDYIIDQDQNEWIRSRFLWSGFVMPPEERDEEARKPGPDLRNVLFRSLQPRPHQAYVHPMMNSGYPSMQQAVFSPPSYPVNGNEIMYQPHDNGMQMDYTSPVSGGAGSSGIGAELNGRLHRGESQLSATVPDFAPGGHGGAPTTLEDYQTYPDEQVEKLVVLVGSELEPSAASESSEHSPNRSQVNGSSSANGALSPTDETSTLQAVGRKVGEEPYPELRAKALEQRANAKPGDTPAAMKHLYRFWSHCLPDKFNVRMYEDFRTLALEDARRSSPNDFGLKCLLRYYNQVLFNSNGARPYPAVFMPHHMEAKQLSESPKARINGGFRA